MPRHIAFMMMNTSNGLSFAQSEVEVLSQTAFTGASCLLMSFDVSAQAGITGKTNVKSHEAFMPV